MSTELDSPFKPPTDLPESASATSFEDSPHPFRFGLKALMLLMALCGVQFSLMSYLGILPGLLVGLAACFLTLLGLVVTAMICWRGSGTPLLHRLDQLAIRLVIAIVLLGIGSFAAGGGMAIYEMAAHWRRATRIRQDLGITAHSQDIVHNNRIRHALLVTDVALGGSFDQAGGQPGDVILCDKGVPQFYDIIEDNRGREITLTVAAGADMPPLEKCVSRSLEVTVPP